MTNIANRQMKALASDEVVGSTDVLYEGPEGLIVTAKSEEAALFWAAEQSDLVGLITEETIKKDGPMIAFIPFTKKLSFGERAEASARICPTFYEVSEECAEALEALVHKACEDKDVAKLLISEARLYESFFPESVWQDKELCLMLVAEQGIDAIGYVPHEFLTLEMFVNEIKGQSLDLYIDQLQHVFESEALTKQLFDYVENHDDSVSDAVKSAFKEHLEVFAEIMYDPAEKGGNWPLYVPQGLWEESEEVLDAINKKGMPPCLQGTEWAQWFDEKYDKLATADYEEKDFKPGQGVEDI